MVKEIVEHDKPLAYVLRTRPFHPLPVELFVRPPTLIPRPETEHWVSLLYHHLLPSPAFDGTSSSPKKPFRILDIEMGTGSFALALASVLSAFPTASSTPIGVDVLVAPPQEGDESYPQWKKEKDGIAETLHQRSQIIWKAFQELEGVSCNEAEGAMYLFPTITLPPKAIAAAKAVSQAPDAYYALRLLESTGISVVPGSGFGQAPSTWHIRTTFLAPGTENYVRRLKEFHQSFLDEFR